MIEKLVSFLTTGSDSKREDWKDPMHFEIKSLQIDFELGIAKRTSFNKAEF